MSIEELEKRVAELEAQKNGAYKERDMLVALVAVMNAALDGASGLGRHPDAEEWEDDWRNIVFVELPTGQCSWHIHDSELPWFASLGKYDLPWDGHTTEEKYERVLQAVGYLLPTSEDIPF